MARLIRIPTRLIALVVGTAIPCGLASAQIAPASEPATHQVSEPLQQPPAIAPIPADPAAPDAGAESVIDVVFVLDTTGSMSGLIEGAKQKIWSIANTIATAQPRPVVRMGLVGYRDRGDAYITKLTPLTDDLDAIYAELMTFEAGGGGDSPESVNQAILEGITLQPWSDDPRALKLVYLVGDAPPHMDYEQDTKYHETCSSAASKGIIINTIQCGGDLDTTPIWQEIARLSEGEYFAIQQNGGVTVIATPFDEELASLGANMAATACGWGDVAAQTRAMSKSDAAMDIAASAPVTAQAERAAYFAGEAGKSSALGQQELVDDVKSGRVKLEEIKKDQLPAEFRELTIAQQQAKIDQIAAEREKIQKRIAELSQKREDYLKAEMDKLGAEARDGFDVKVTECLREQASRKGISVEKK
jgi:Mg-chelatase subunit ChlD